MTRTLGAALLAVVLAVGCSDDGGGEEQSAEVPAPTIDPSASVSPIQAEAPAGFRLADQGFGSGDQVWGSDSFGNQGPFVVLAPDGDTTDPAEVTTVTATGFQGYQGGLEQASDNYADGEFEELELRGRRAIFSQGSGEGDEVPFTELLVERGEDVALAIKSPDLTRDELIEVDEAFSVHEDPDVHQVAPPGFQGVDGLELVGSASVDLEMALEDYHSARPRSYALRFEREDSTVWVTTLPGDRGDPRALIGFRDAFAFEGVPGPAEVMEIDGREAVMRPGEDDTTHLVTTTAWGDLLVIGAESTDLGEDDLVALAESVQQA